ncbi:MAG: putative transcriptional regulator [Clostridia bacterium]|nr:putative transcriptional regulator [Clostridia bacterium]
MEYTIKKLASLSGISTRTLRYYDEINLLKPVRINSSGYRIYGKTEVDRLQQILFYKELDVNLEDIKKIINTPGFNAVNALKEHREKLLNKREQLNILIKNVEKTIITEQGVVSMSDKEKFEGFKQDLINENEKTYGKEIREKYGDDTINKSNQKVKNMTKQQYDEVTKLSDDFMKTIIEAYKIGDPACELAQKAAEMHKNWLCYYWDSYSTEAHAGLGQMYVDDSRFTEFYDKHQPGLAIFLRDAILVYTNQK